MKISSIIKFIVCGLIMFLVIGCGGKEPAPAPIIKVDMQKVYIPVYCESPKILCEFSGDGVVTIGKLIKCISDLKAANAFCNKDKIESHINEMIKTKDKEDMERK